MNTWWVEQVQWATWLRHTGANNGGRRSCTLNQWVIITLGTSICILIDEEFELQNRENVISHLKFLVTFGFDHDAYINTPL
jgi:hypothetical protein